MKFWVSLVAFTLLTIGNMRPWVGRADGESYVPATGLKTSKLVSYQDQRSRFPATGRFSVREDRTMEDCLPRIHLHRSARCAVGINSHAFGAVSCITRMLMRAAKLTSLSSSTSTSENWASRRRFRHPFRSADCDYQRRSDDDGRAQVSASPGRAFRFPADSHWLSIGEELANMPQGVIRCGGGHGGVFGPQSDITGRSPHSGFLTLRCWGRVSLKNSLGYAPAGYTFLEPKDFSDLRSSAFGGIAEWDSFAEHVLGCTRCGEV